MSSSPRISIGVPVYNGEKFLAETLNSLLSQTVEDFELIISDNASTDGTAEICRSYAARDRRVRYIRNETNIGACANCNSVFRRAVGEFFKLNMADDVSHPQLLARCLEVMDASPEVVLTYGKARFIDNEGRWLDIIDPGWNLMHEAATERMRYVIASGHWVNLFYGLMRSSTLARTRLLPSYASGDYRLIGELALLGQFYEIPEYLFFRRLHAGASSQNRSADWQSLFFKGHRGRAELPFWHLCVDHTLSVLRSDLGPREKLSCIRAISERLLAGKRQLLLELHSASVSLYRSACDLSRRTN
jgi:glycosyltransferase involved in cell wall biosynthesis